MQPGFITTLFVCALTLVAPPAARAHDVPAEVTVVAFVKPVGDRLTLVVRLPALALGPSSILFGGLIIPTRASGSVDVNGTGQPLMDAARVVANLLPVYEGDRGLELHAVNGARLSLPDDRSFASYDAAVAHVIGGALAGELEAGQGFFDTMLEYRIESSHSDFSIQPRITALAQRPAAAIRFVPAGTDSIRAYEVTAATGRFRLDPHWYHAAFTFVRAGFVHILEGADHLLFLLCLVIPISRWQSLVPMVSAFTIAHSTTLIASTYRLVPGGDWFAPTIETLIAASIVYMAVENAFVASPRRRWLATFAFGLAHGFGFSVALRESLQFAGAHLFASVLSFNVGVELGQLAVLVIAGPALGLLFRHVVAERLARTVLSVIVAHVGWHWFTERGSELLQVIGWPSLPSGAEPAVPWLLALVVVAGLLRVTGLGSRHWQLPRGAREPRGA